MGGSPEGSTPSPLRQQFLQAPSQQHNNQDDDDDAADANAASGTEGVIAATAAKEQYENQDYEEW